MRVITLDHSKIKQWAQKHQGIPEIITGYDEVGLRIDFPGKVDDIYLSPDKFPQKISWEDFFRIFEEEALAFIYDDSKEITDYSSAYQFIKRENT